MWLAVIVALVPLAALALAGQPPQKALVLDMKAAPGTESVAHAATNVLAVELQKRKRFDVITAGDVRSAIEQEANRRSLGCDTSSESCLAEIAGAMGAEVAFYGDVARLGDLYVVTLNGFDAKTGRAIGRVTVEVTNVSAVPDRVRAAVPDLLGEGGAGFGALGWSGVALGGAGVVVGAAGALWAAAMSSLEADPKSARTDKELAASTHAAAGIAALAGAAAAVAGGGLGVAGALSE